MVSFAILIQHKGVDIAIALIIVMVRLVDECELGIDVTNIVHHSESYSIDIKAGTDCDSANESLNSSSNESSDDDFDVEELELIRL
ncbi:hypothetical protein RND71_014521 [Anisodus tanguticus]|uniref:Uncharacterized protein n=1 Tax=Anisodus tanguticus TaxID=243964 RepID=A0AAE1VJZ5_9SOLA|nr:hypothetical protein RND71_014521 [Anisodus tanguticus]